ncbi:hypothetical protein [Vogesella urethralis]|uniref:hypothetical protein n=1 Tax=Vogesella urethralis TaxID=2592656 RepID=UPI001185ACAA|nr:hypothetical protein [Vogesella urethralis]
MLLWIALFSLGFFFGYIFKLVFPYVFIYLTTAEILNIAGTWLSSIGTIAAVLATVRYANKSINSMIPSLEIKPRLELKRGQFIDDIVLQLEFMNKSQAPVQLQSVLLKDGNYTLEELTESFKSSTDRQTFQNPLLFLGQSSQVNFKFQPFSASLLISKNSDVKIIVVASGKTYSLPFPMKHYIALENRQQKG